MPNYLEDRGRVQFREMPDAQVVFFAGAGISAESGLSTFRDKDGLWSKYDQSKVCTMSNYHLHKEEVFEFYNALKSAVQTAQPNAAHKAIAELQLEFPEKVAVVTSNVDDLFEKAGCQNVLHVHGDFEHLICTYCFHKFYIGQEKFILSDEKCPCCGKDGQGRLKPGVVFFGEQSLAYGPFYDLFAQEDVTDKVIIGTTMHVNPPNFFSLRPNNRSYYLDQKPNKSYVSLFTEVHRKKATDSVPELVKKLKKLLQKN